MTRSTHDVPRPSIPSAPGLEVPDIERLREYPFLATLSETVLRKLQPNLVEQVFEAGQTILRTGAYTDAAYYVAEGVVEIRLTEASIRATLRGESSSPPAAARAGATFVGRAASIVSRQPLEDAVQLGGRTIAGTLLLSDLPIDMAQDRPMVLAAGDVFGEMSALSRYPVATDIVARTRARCLMIRTPALRMMFKQRELAEFKKLIDDRYRTRSLALHLRNVSLFEHASPEIIAGLQRRAELLSFEPGAMIVEQGAPSDAFYLVRGGYVKVASRVGQADLPMAYLRKGDHAGEAGLLLDEPWPFTLQALEHVELVKISKDDFTAVVSEYPEVQRALWAATVERLKTRGYVARKPLAAQYLQVAMDSGLMHGESVLMIDLSTCTRCDDCVRACADTHGGVPRFIREGERFRNWSVPAACYQCTDPVCMIGCPTGAITRPLGTLEVTINKDTCVGCHNCSKRCPWNNIVEVPFDSPTLSRSIELASKCDLCLGRPQGPACVQMCPHGSAVRISFKDLEKVAETLSW